MSAYTVLHFWPYIILYMRSLCTFVWWRGYGNLSTGSIAIPRTTEGQVGLWYYDAKWVQISMSKQKKCNEFIPWLNVWKFLTLIILLVCSKSSHEHDDTRSGRSVIANVWRSVSSLWCVLFVRDVTFVGNISISRRRYIPIYNAFH